ncbi:MAG: hypothetical protein KatS3mg033_1600 [Thermonema sp.]|uniref:PorP/SprF family type IX secretion system membrane protein n=1 Tax=Thermonema sp. TaxID=2231181 RepID=UPI0021DC3DD6|nr:PorP/SprF family type IX secretion system membrane protein [Thermonema sp.]GIV39800.1 MAG: hypothetical protein KatS3mg033_1600 [Thermonema sp.]
MLRYLCIGALFGCMLLSQEAGAQAELFTQQEAVSSWLNPASVGSELRGSARLLYRRQYIGDGYSLRLPSFQFQYPMFNKDQTHHWGGVGLAFMQEQLGRTSVYKNTGIALSLAYAMPLNEETKLSFGMQAAYFLRRIEEGNISTEYQYLNGVLGEPALSGEDFSRLQVGYPAIQSGMIIRRQRPAENTPLFELGVSGAALNQPNVSFYRQAVLLPPRLFAFLKLRAWHSRESAVFPSLRWTYQAGGQQWRVGAEYYRAFPALSPVFKEGAIGMAAWWQGSYLMGSLRLRQAQYQISFSYDVNIGKEGYPTAFELGIAWIKPFELKKKSRRRRLSAARNQTQPQEAPKVIVFTREPVEVKPPKANIALTGAEKELLQSSIYFEQGSSLLSDSAQKKLKQVAEVLLKHPEIFLKIEGHTCSFREEMGNEKLSMERAYAVRTFLKAQGIEEKRMIVDAMADRKPVATNETEAGRRLNRRVTLVPLL